MECVIPKHHVKIFARALSCLAKIGTDLVIETTDQKCIFRVVSQAQSAYAYFAFDAHVFFTSYAHARRGVFVKCKVNVRNCILALKTLTGIENIRLQLLDQENENVLVLELQLQNGIKRIYCFNFEEHASILYTNFDRNVPIVIAAKAKNLSQCIANFHSGVEEITLIATEKALRVKSYIDEEGESTRQQNILQTEYTLDREEFVSFDVRLPDGCEQADITFCLKEFKAVLNFCESVDQSIHVLFEWAGQPVLLSNSANGDGVDGCVADVVIATLQGPDQPESQAQSSRSQHAASQAQSQQAPSQPPRPHSPSSASTHAPRSPSQRNAEPSFSQAETVASNFSFDVGTQASRMPSTAGSVSGWTSRKRGRGEREAEEDRECGSQDSQDGLSTLPPDSMVSASREASNLMRSGSEARRKAHR